MKIAVLTEVFSTRSGSRAPIDLARALSGHNQIKILTRKPALGLAKLISELRTCDIISFHGTFWPFLAAKLSGKPIVRTYYGTQLDAYLEKLLPGENPTARDKILNFFANRLIMFIQKIFFTLSAQSVAISAYSASEAYKLYGIRIPHLYLGSYLQPKTVQKHKDTVILSVSRLTPYKGFHLLIQAFRQACRQIPHLKLIIIGTKAKAVYLNYLNKITKNEKNIQIISDVSDAELAKAYGQCDIYATCDRFLFFGLPVAEAAIAGKPAIALDYAAARELIIDGQTGFVAKSLPEFTDKLKKLANKPKMRTRMGKAAKKRAALLFNWKNIASGYRKIFSQALAGKKKTTFKFPLIIALAISLIFGLPHLLIPLFQGGFNNYYPLTVNRVPMVTFEETFVYAAQAREICDGHPFSADFDLFEYKNLAVNFFPLPALAAGSIGCLLGSVPSAFVVFDFLLPPLIFITLYFLIRILTDSKPAAVLGGVLVLTADRLFLFIPPVTLPMVRALWDIFRIDPNNTTLLEFSRYPHPQLSFLILALYLLFLLNAVKNGRIRNTAASGLLLGLLFYTYIYYWTFAVAGTGILCLILIFQKKFQTAKIIIYVLSAGLILSLPFWILFRNYTKLPGYKDILERMGLEPGYFRNILRTIQYLIFSVITGILVKKKTIYFWFLVSFLLGGIFCLNIQLITGFSSQSWHWVIRAINPLVIIMIVYLLNEMKLLKHGLMLLTVLLLGRAAALQYITSKNSWKGYTLPQTTVDAYSWLNKNTPIDSVVASPGFGTGCLLPVYTHNNVFLPFTTIAANREITERLLLTYKIFNITPEKLAQILAYKGDGMGDCRGNYCLIKSEFWEKQAIIQLYYMKYLQKNENLYSWSTAYEMPISEQKKILSEYSILRQRPNQKPENFRLDYLYYGPDERKISSADFNRTDWLKKVYENKDVAIYQVKK